MNPRHASELGTADSAAAPHTARPTRAQRLALGLAVVAALSLPWPPAYEMTRPDHRPYVGSTTGNSMFELLVGHNGAGSFISRLTGSAARAGAGGGAGWLLPSALLTTAVWQLYIQSFATIGDATQISRRIGADLVQREIDDWIRAHGRLVDRALWRPRGSRTRAELYDLRPDNGVASIAPRCPPTKGTACS